MVRPMMRQKPCPLLCFLLCLSLTVAGLVSAAAGVAMAQTAGYSQIVICSGNGPTVVTLDASGNPVAPAKPCADCPDCITGQGFVAALPDIALGAEPRFTAATPTVLPAIVALRLLQAASARAPPQKA